MNVQPYGAGSDIRRKLKLPVVHVGYRDAFAFCVWANKRLPTEVEWEYIARAAKNGSYCSSISLLIRIHNIYMQMTFGVVTCN